METTFYNADECPAEETILRVAEFLQIHLGVYGDPIYDIRKAISHALGESGIQGGFVATVTRDNELVAASVVNRTGMQDYIPENILVYIAVRNDCRGEGVGRRLLAGIINHAKGDIALHVEPGNPAIHLYESFGFENKYLEMRFQRKEV